jgi:hypothetical protein
MVAPSIGSRLRAAMTEQGSSYTKTAVKGTLVARPARTTMLAGHLDRDQVGRRVRPVRGDYRLVGRARRARQPGGEMRTPRSRPPAQ